MTDEGNEERRQPARSLEDLVVPRRPAGVPYGDGDDYDSRALILANGYTEEAGDLLGLLTSDLAILQAAAAHMLGVKGKRSAIPALESLANNAIVDETVRVQAAFALARMSVESGPALLARLLELPPEASPAPLQAAGALARLGDPRGFQKVRASLDSPNAVTAMVACKQLFAFAPLDGGSLDVYEAFGRALERSERNIVGEARAQLEALGTEKARATLAAHPA